jgi:hypothetical protein
MKISERIVLVLKRSDKPMTSREIADVLGDVSVGSVAVACSTALCMNVRRVYGAKPHAPASWQLIARAL